MSDSAATTSLFRGYRFPPEIISNAVWLYHRFALSHRDVEELPAERGIQVSCEAIRLWCRKFGPLLAAELRRRHPRRGDDWYLDEVALTMNSHRYLLWRAVDQDGTVLDILVQSRCDQQAAERFLRLSIRAIGYELEVGRVVGLEVNDDHLTGVRLEDGTVVARQALVVGAPTVARSEVLASLGLAPVEHPLGLGQFIRADPTGLTDVPGVWVAGNVTDLSATVIGAAAQGVVAAAAINADLVAEDTRRAVTRRQLVRS